jgi:hypothetical protein
MATTVLSLAGFVFIDGSWTGVYLITSELFPTVLRYIFIHTNMIFHFLAVSLSPTIYCGA